ncbi:hypothetical protein FO519_007025 [Halicephalobus sp. NKZ332]|nr:hypothetical protein FO519_007025 [Halicephalobus sp. NKZ332]
MKMNTRKLFWTPAKDGDEFRLIDVTEDAVIIGAKDHVYQLTHETLTPRDTIEWSTKGQVVEECQAKGRPLSECHNFIRVVAKRKNDHLLVCGTHAFSPQCREYEYVHREGGYRSKRDFNGKALTPYHPRANFTYVYSTETNEIFVATVSDFNGNDPLIYKKKIPSGESLRTQKDDLRVLDHPDFVGSFSFNDYLYVFFRERASESSDQQIYSRVGRMCKNDRGGPGTTQDRWSSFLKARLNCSVPADVPFYFNELQSVSSPVLQENGDYLLYAVLSTSRSAVLMSAVCAFKMSEIDHVFNSGHLKATKAASPYSHRIQKMSNIDYHPGKCVDDSRKLPDVSFILKNPLLSDLINAVDQPIIVEGPSKPDLTNIAVVGMVKSADRMNVTYDVIFIGRNDGHIVKAVKIPNHGSVIIEAVKVFDNPPTVIQAIRPMEERNELVVVGSDRVAKIPIYHCSKQASCSKCVGLRDPHCAWDTDNLICTHSSDWSSGSFIQNIAKGVSAQCPEGISNEDPGYAINMQAMDGETSTDTFNQMIDGTKEGGFSGTMIAMFIILVILVATGIGFMVGYRLSRKRFISELQAAHSSGSSSNGSDYDSYGRARLTRHDSLTTTSKIGNDMYSLPHRKVSDAVSLVLAHGQHIPVLTASISNANSGYTTPHHRLEHAAMLINNGSTGGGSAGSGSIASHAPSCTLPRDYRVRKVYL